MKIKKKIIIGLILILSSIGIYYAYTNMMSTEEEYTSTAVIRGNISNVFMESGEILSDNINGYFSDGMKRVKTINVAVGDVVNSDDILLEFESTVDLEIEKVNQEIKSLESAFNEAVKGVDFETVNSVRLEIAGVRNSLALAEETLERTQKLHAEGVIAKSELDSAELSVTQLRNQIALLNNQYNLLVKGVSSDVKQQYEAQIGSLAVTLDILEKTRSNYIVKANFDGVITELNAFVGSIPMAGTMVLELQDPSNKSVYADFLVDEAVRIEEGMPASIENKDLDLLIDNLTVTQIYPKAIAKLSELGVVQKRVTITVGLPDSLDQLVLGTNVDVEVTIEEKENVLLVPESAVFEKNRQYYVTVIENGQMVEKQIVKGLEDSDFIEIISGLNEGDLVRTD
ncbi:MAG: HlyD family efflux transporter periplasmic adaptor subunit [Dethiosulfatibacter sp.]|nr:HlyD family efflux transporter periplasmic adaptor subunit [Dethiosulfatibacter sp.]